jgi:hypothetical protein
MMSDKQIDFLVSETGFQRSDFINMGRKKVKEIRELCIDIECDENVACDHKPLSERGQIATSLVDDLLKWLNEDSQNVRHEA